MRNAMGENGSRTVYEDFYVYQLNFLSLAGATSATGNINIQASSDFVLQKMTYAANIGAAIQQDQTRVIPIVNMQVTDAGSGNTLFSASTPVSAIMGDGRLPFILPKPKIFPAKSTITVDVSNLTSATTYNLFLSFIGYRVYRTGM